MRRMIYHVIIYTHILSRTANFPYLVDPLSAITARSKNDGTTIISSLNDTDLDGAALAATHKTAALVFISADSGEGYITVEGNFGDRYMRSSQCSPYSELTYGLKKRSPSLA